MTKPEILDLARKMAAQNKVECRGPLQVFGFPDRIGIRFRDRSKRQGDQVPKVTVAFSADEDAGIVNAKLATAINCLKYGIQTGWNKIEEMPALDVRKAR